MGVSDKIHGEEERRPERGTSKWKVSRDKREIISGDEGQYVGKDTEIWEEKKQHYRTK